jgi:hypothetical protein
MPRQRGEAVERGGVGQVGVLEDDSNVGIGVIVADIRDSAGIVDYLHARIVSRGYFRTGRSNRDIKPRK